MKKEFPMFLSFNNDRTYSIQGYIGEVDEYKDNKGYIDSNTGKIYICSKDEPPVHNDVPILKIDGDSFELIESNNPTTSEIFQEVHLYDLSYDNIVNETKGDEVLYNEEALADMNAATSIFVPTINEYDDPLKKLIKQVIISKKIDINRLKHRMPQKYGLTNMKSALVGKTKMSINNFNVWCELLGITYEVIITDNGSDSQNPLPNVIHYASDSDRIIETNV